MSATSNAILILGILPVLFLAKSTVPFIQVVSGISFCLFAIGFVRGITIPGFHMALGEQIPSFTRFRPSDS